MSRLFLHKVAVLAPLADSVDRSRALDAGYSGLSPITLLVCIIHASGLHMAPPR